MKYLLKYKTILTTLVMALLILVMGSDVEAKTITRKVTEDKATAYIGSTYNLNGSEIKINGKSISKFKKKVKANAYLSSEDGYGYYTGSYYTDSDAYKAGTGRADSYRYVPSKSYEFTFLKTGTYKLSDVSYSHYYDGYDIYQISYNRSEYVNDAWQYYYTVQQITYSEANGYEYKDVSTEEYVEKYLDNDNDGYSDYTYYQGTKSGKIYAYGSYGITPAKIKTGADKKQHLYYEANVVKTTSSKSFKVLKTDATVSSVQLGKSKITYKDTRTTGGWNDVSTSSQFLSGSSGKLTVKMADKNYGLTSIVVMTYDKDNNPVYKLVKNKAKVTYGAYKYQYEYKSEYSKYMYKSQTMYKPTYVYVNYKNKFTGAFCKITKIEKDADGNYQFTYQYRGPSDTKTETYTTSYLPDSYQLDYVFYKK